MRQPTVMFRMLIAMALGAALVACSSNRYPPAPASAAMSDYRYVIGPLDTVNIVVWRNPELSMSVPVRPDGRISTPLVEDVPALGKQSGRTWRVTSRRRCRSTSAIPSSPSSSTASTGRTTEQIRIVGEATKPQAVAYRQNMTLLDVMIVVGGLTDFADGNKAVLVRGSEQGKQYSVRLGDLVRRGDISANVDVRPGDILIIPQSWF